MACCIDADAEDENSDLASDSEDINEHSRLTRADKEALQIKCGGIKHCPKLHPLVLQPADANATCSECLQSEHKQMWSCQACYYKECDPCVEKYVTDMDFIKYEKMLQAQLVVLAHMHFLLPLSPVAFIDCYVDDDFIDYYLKMRTQYTLLLVVVFAFGLGAVPGLYGHTLMPYPCVVADYSENDIYRNGTVTLQRQGCVAEDWFRSVEALKGMYQLAAFNLLLTLALVLICNFQPKLWRYLVPFAKSRLPRVLYNGFDGLGTDHSSWKRFFKRGYAHHWSYLHDWLGTRDIILYCISSVASTSIYLVVFGWQMGGTTGASVGAVILFPLYSSLLYVMNHVFGASTRFINFVDELLLKRLPHEKYFNVNEIFLESIRGEVRRTRERIEKRARSLEEEKRLRRLCDEDGERILLFVAKWIQRKLRSGLETPQSLFDLFHSDHSIFVCTEVTVASFVFLDMAHFLILYWDDNDDMFPSWRKERTLEAVCISKPRRLMCSHANPRWKFEKKEDIKAELSTEYSRRFCWA